MLNGARIRAMSRFRISLATLLMIVAVVALGLAGMVSASRFWTAAAATVTLALLLAAVLAAWLLAGADRAFWAGFALFGWVYLLLVNWDWVGGQFGHDLTAGLSAVAEAIFPEVAPTGPPQVSGALAFGLRTPPDQTAVGPRAPAVVAPTLPPSPSAATIAGFDFFEMTQQRQIKIGNFVQIGRMLLALLFALLGGFLARTMAERRDAQAGSAGPGAVG
jgi:hypothetical protein